MTGARLAGAMLQRHRWALMVISALMAGSAGLLTKVSSAGIPDGVRAFVATLTFLSILYLCGVFIHPESDVVACRSAYPAHYFTLPVSNAHLVLWPMGTGVVVVGGSTYFMAAALKASGVAITPAWTAAMAAALLAMLQAVLWLPLSVPYARLLLSAGIIFAAILIGPGGSIIGVAEGTRTMIFLCSIPVAAAFALVGVTRARRGDSSETAFLDRLQWSRKSKRALSFSNAKKAQLWYEWRMQGKYLPFAAGLLLTGMLCMLHWEHDLAPLYQFRKAFNEPVPTAPVLLSVYFPTILMLIPLTAWVIGCGARRTDVKGSDRTFHLFYGTRPMSDAGLVWSKLATAAKSTFLAWAIVLFGSMALLFQTCGFEAGGVALTEHGPLYSVVLPAIPQQWWIQEVALILCLAFLTWRNHIVAYWAELSGIRYLRAAYPVLLVFGIALWGVWAPRMDNGGMRLVADIIHAAVTLKLLLAAALTILLIRRRVLSQREIFMLFGGFVLLATALGAIAWIATAQWREDLMSLGTAPVAFLNLAPWLAVLYVPVVRTQLAFLGLSRTRHG